VSDPGQSLGAVHPPAPPVPPPAPPVELDEVMPPAPPVPLELELLVSPLALLLELELVPRLLSPHPRAPPSIRPRSAAFVIVAARFIAAKQASGGRASRSKGPVDPRAPR
jgi:hypothetical protein